MTLPDAPRKYLWVLAMCFSPLVHAETVSPDLETARRLLAAGQATQAAALLEPNLLQFSGNPEYDYLLGQAWYQMGRAGDALFAFERVLIADPDNVEVRLKTARISTERGNTAATQALLAPLATAKLSTTQQQEVEQIRTLLSSNTGSSTTSVSGYLAAGAGWDDNVTGGPNLTSVMVPVTIMAPGAKGKPPVPKLVMQSTSLGTSTKGGDMLGTLDAGLSVRQAWNDSTWLTGDGSLHQGINHYRKDVTEGSANLNLGVIKRAGSAYIGATWLMQNYMVSNATYRKSQGGRLNWLHPVNDHANLGAYIQRLTFEYPTATTSNAVRTLFGVNYQSTMDTTQMLYGIYAGRESAQDLTKPSLNFAIVGVNVGRQWVLNSDVSLSAGLAYEQHRHGAIDTLFGIFRNDAQYAAAIAADYALAPHWHVLPRYTYTHNVSNLALYDYIRNTFSFQLKWDFDNENE
ncbi:MAG: tetratricopeptide repeat protein [Gallionella sp.]|nr:tetratricopeptide repeat protein [Gallionella sp.]